MRLDAARGMFLVIMAGIHVPSPVSRECQDPFGFNSAAEGFIFLSACLAGFIYGKVFAKNGWTAMARRLGNRARLVYIVHLATLLPMALIAWIYAGQLTPYAWHFHDFLVHPRSGLLLMPLLLQQPPLFDILPMYVLFLGLSPFVLAGARRLGWGMVLALSFLGWLAAQFPALHFWDNISGWLPVCWGSFDLVAWQFLWTAGLALGETLSRRPLIPQNARVVLGALAGVLVLACFCVRRGIIPGAWINPDIFLWMDKWTLGPLRLLNCAAWVVLLVAWNPKPPGWLLAPTALLGRNSLAVFVMHLPLVICAAAIIQIFSLPDAMQSVLAASVIAALFLWAAWLENNARQRVQFAARHGNATELLPWFKRLQYLEIIRSGPLKFWLPAG